MTKQTDPQYKLRLPSEVKEALDAAAGQSGRSLNAEIVLRLRRSFESANVQTLKDELLSAQMEAAVLRLNLDEAEAMASLSDDARQRVRSMANEWSCEFADALERAVLAGASNGSRGVLYVEAKAGATLDDYRLVFQAAAESLQPDIETIFKKSGDRETPATKKARRTKPYLLPKSRSSQKT